MLNIGENNHHMKKEIKFILKLIIINIFNHIFLF